MRETHQVGQSEIQKKEREYELDEPRRKIFLKTGSEIHAQETACTKKGAKQPIRSNHEPCAGVKRGDQGIEKGSGNGSDEGSEESRPCDGVDRKVEKGNEE